MRGIAITLALFGALSTLAACGSDTSRADPIQQIGQALLTRALNRGPQIPPDITDQQIAGALAATTDRLVLIDLDDLNTQAMVLQIESNGEYDTLGTSSRQAVTMRDGLITASRGLGGDLMSSDTDALLAQIQSGEAGVAPYAMRFLSGEEVIYTYSYTCGVRPTGSVPVARGLLNLTGQQMTAVCTGDGPAFEAVFVTDDTGYIVKSKQWLGDFIGTALTQTLRK